MKKKVEKAIEESKRLAVTTKERFIPVQCECKLRNDQPFTSMALCPMHGDERVRRKHQ